MTIIVITDSYPYDVPDYSMWLDPEVEYLASVFDRVIIVPSVLTGKRNPTLPAVEVEESYAQKRPKGQKLKILYFALTSLLFYRDIAARPKTIIQAAALKRLLRFVADAKYTCRWIRRFIGERNIDPATTLFYTYWLQSSTMGIGMAKKEFPMIRLISRAHGDDIYEKRHKPPYIPCRKKLLEALDYLFLASRAAKLYFAEQYPWFGPSCEVFRLGVKDSGTVSNRSDDGICRIVSCSTLVGLKRVELLLEGIKAAAVMKPRQYFEWHHIGTGPLWDQIQKSAHKELPQNVKCRFHGWLPNSEVFSFYRDNPVDLFITVSRSEGGVPVSIQEAQSCGIPAVGTSVGGIPEIISSKNGKLLNADPTNEEIAAAICEFLDNPELAIQRRKASRIMWKKNYNADTNYEAFASRLKSCLEQRHSAEKVF